MKSVMRIERNATGYVVTELINGVPNPELVSLFGTATLPTPFTSAAAPEEVVARIKVLNPESEVEFK